MIDERFILYSGWIIANDDSQQGEAEDNQQRRRLHRNVLQNHTSNSSVKFLIVCSSRKLKLYKMYIIYDAHTTRDIMINT